MLWPDNAPWWLNFFIWMAFSWQWILIGFVPTFYIAIAKLFGMPILQRWSNEVVVILYPSKIKFGKIKEQGEPYFRKGKYVYWYDQPLQPMPYDTPYEELPVKVQEKLAKLKEKYNVLSEKKGRTKKDEKEMKNLVKQGDKLIALGLNVKPINQLHIYTHAVNQPIYKMERRESKVDEILNNAAKLKNIPGHGIWLLQNPRLHFHRHYQILVHPDGTYQIIPVKDRQQFSIGFWHSLGIIVQREVEQEKEVDMSTGQTNGKQLVQTVVTTHVVLQQMKQVQDFQNYSASRAFMILKRRAKLEDNFSFWIQGSINPVVWIALIGMVGAVAAIFMLFHGGGGSAPPTPGGRIL